MQGGLIVREHDREVGFGDRPHLHQQRVLRGFPDGAVKSDMCLVLDERVLGEGIPLVGVPRGQQSPQPATVVSARIADTACKSSAIRTSAMSRTRAGVRSATRIPR